ncbi:MAG: DUF6541 family protein [Ilumatobacteraceae bacterium]
MEEGAEGCEEGQAGASHARLIAAAPFAIVTVVGLWLTRSFWFPGRYVVGFDTYAYSGPNLEVTERALRNWRLPVLNDLIFGGVPHLGNPSALALYPPQWLTLPFGTNRSMGLLVAAHVVLLGVGMVVLARRLGVGRVGATAGAVIAMASGSTLTKSVQFEQILVLAWIPMLLATIHAVLTSDRPWRAVAGLSATTAAILLAGHPQLVYEAAFLGLAALIGFAIDDHRWRRLPHVATGALLGVGIALPQLVAVLYATADSAIAGGRELSQLSSPALSLEPELIARALLGTVQDRDPAAFAGGFESIAFLGVVAAIVAVVGCVQAITDRRSRPWAISFTVAASLALVWAAGPRTPVFRIAFDLVPGFDLARASARWLVIFVLVAALFAGIGVDVAWRRAHRHHLAGAVGAVVAVSLLLAAGLLEIADSRSAAIWAITAVTAIAMLAVSSVSSHHRLVRAGAVALIVLAALELTVMSTHSLPQAMRSDVAFTSHRTATTEFLAGQDSGLVLALTDDSRPAGYQVPGMRPNANALASVPSIDGYDGGVQITERWADALRRLTPTPATELPLRNSLDLPIEPAPLGRLGVRWILLDRQRPPEVFIPGWSGPVVTDDSFEVWENPTWTGDAVAWSSAVVSEDPAELLRESPATAALAAVVTDPVEAFACTADQLRDCAPVGLAIERSRPERIEIATGFDRPTLVSVSQQALPGWRVEVDGEPADVVVVDGLFLGVRVPGGDHSVSFRYESPWLGTSLLISLAATATTIALAVGATVTARRRTSQAAGGGDR